MIVRVEKDTRSGKMIFHGEGVGWSITNTLDVKHHRATTSQRTPCSRQRFLLNRLSPCQGRNVHVRTGRTAIWSLYSTLSNDNIKQTIFRNLRMDCLYNWLGLGLPKRCETFM